MFWLLHMGVYLWSLVGLVEVPRTQGGRREWRGWAGGRLGWMLRTVVGHRFRG